ncbi:hypothetical protein M422DRAFT_42659 [Sphaerobolus stellatus SS14]|nr:hypothetical protein M422DRAFT_42659 [Sphaerobolus stellatus SS14]
MKWTHFFRLFETTDNTLGIFAIFASLSRVIPLKDLTLHGVDISTEDIMLSFLSRMPYMESLCIENNLISDLFLESLGLKNGILYLFPKLKELRFVSFQLSIIDLLEMIKGRIENVSREKIPKFSIWLHDVNGITDDGIELLHGLQREHAGVLAMSVSKAFKFIIAP